MQPIGGLVGGTGDADVSGHVPHRHGRHAVGKRLDREVTSLQERRIAIGPGEARKSIDRGRVRLVHGCVISIAVPGVADAGDEITGHGGLHQFGLVERPVAVQGALAGIRRGIIHVRRHGATRAENVASAEVPCRAEVGVVAVVPDLLLLGRGGDIRGAIRATEVHVSGLAFPARPVALPGDVRRTGIVAHLLVDFRRVRRVESLAGVDDLVLDHVGNPTHAADVAVAQVVEGAGRQLTPLGDVLIGSDQKRAAKTAEGRIGTGSDRRLTSRGKGGQQKGHEEPDDRDDDEQLHEREADPRRERTMTHGKILFGFRLGTIQPARRRSPNPCGQGTGQK